MMQVDEGVVGIITNHSFLDNPTFRGMRQSLTRTFDQVRVIDLHGNLKKKEQAPDGGKDENVFDIEQGVAITLLIKKPGLERGVWRGDVWGKRQEKYNWAVTASANDIELERLEPQLPLFLFQARDNEAAAAYERLRSVRDIFPINSVGIATARDSLTIHFTASELRDIVRDFAEREPEDARKIYNLGKDARDWKVLLAQEDARQCLPSDTYKQSILYRPFDKRFTLYTGHSRGFQCMPRPDVMRHMLKPNVGLITSRLTKGERFAHAQVTDTLSEVICMSPKTSNNGFLFPLYLYPPEQGKKPSPAFRDLYTDADPFAGKKRIENIAPEFRAWLDECYDRAYTPEQLLGYIYAVLHAPTYRARYADLLRTDFPRIPFADTRAQFEELSVLGWDLVKAHLLRDVPARGLGRSPGKGSNLVEKVRWSPAERKVWINATQAFTHVPERVWSFTIGGYQVIDKYLKSRKGRTLTLDEIEQVARIANVLDFTIDQMAAIDEAYLAAFPGGDAGGNAIDAANDDVVIDPEIMGGEPVFRGTRIPVRAIAEIMAAGADVDEMLAGYPTLTAERLAFAGVWAAANPPEPIPPERSNFPYRVISRRTHPRRGGGSVGSKARA